MPSAIPFGILGEKAHCFTFFFYIVLKLMTSSESHSGFEFPWSPVRIFPFLAGASFHDHHHSGNDGNYAGFIYPFDVLIGSCESYCKEFLDIKND